MASTRVPASTETVGELGSYLRLYERSLRAANHADTTIYKYRLAALQLIDFLTDAGCQPTPTAANDHALQNRVGPPVTGDTA
jgi:hypothetical protein